MAAIDLVVLGMIKKQPLSAYDIQKLVEYRNISKWVKISTPSIYKKVIQLEEKGYIRSSSVKEGKMPEKAVYSATKLLHKDKKIKSMLQICSLCYKFVADTFLDACYIPIPRSPMLHLVNLVPVQVIEYLYHSDFLRHFL